MQNLSIDQKIRITAFNWLQEKVELFGDVLKRELLQTGFTFQGQQIPLVSPQGIFKPKLLDLPLSITSTVKSHYQDKMGYNGNLLYRYRGTDPNHRDNIGLRELMRQNKPLVYFHGIIPGKYLAIWPVYIVGDDPSSLSFTVAVDDSQSLNMENNIADNIDNARRKYLTTSVLVRMHQRSFREKVLAAYKEQCAFCKLQHSELLDAAHIISDKEPEGNPTVNNGIALCKLHHAAFDRMFIGIRPDYLIEVRQDILHEIDGPMLLHGLQEMHNKTIILPTSATNWPDPELLEKRYNRFKLTGS